MTEIYTLRLPELREKESFLLDSAGGRRKEKALRFIQRDDRLRSLAAGYLMQKYLPGYSEDRLETGKQGKPFLRGGPAFSLSHGGQYVALAWDEAAEGVGIDVEPIEAMETYRPILSFYATAEEQKAIGSDAAEAVRIWTRKESLYKCVGEGISDFRELPAALEDQVTFSGMPCRLSSWEEDRHMFSIALRGFHEPIAFCVKRAEI